ncbi:MAG: family 43 glycosylhydrolase, partial [Pirellulales bacterium]|nr:family 43 glycosylhydrolase [Pirellulales bacterium]
SAGKPICNHTDWVDTRGRPISCHEGGITRVGDTFYWYGTCYEGNPRFLFGPPAAGLQRDFNVYSSKNLVDWKYEGVCLEFPKKGPNPFGRTTSHRPNVLYNAKTKKYVMWFFICLDYPGVLLHVAVADNPMGPFKILGPRYSGEKSHGWAQDLGLFKDDDGRGYLVYDDGHRNIRVDLLSDDYTESSYNTVIALKSHGKPPVHETGIAYEGAAMIKYKGKYIVAGSGVVGANNSETCYAVADSPLGSYKEMGRMSEQKTWNSQISNFVYIKESDKVFAICDQWFVGPHGVDRNMPADRSRQLWLPIDFNPETGVAKMLHVEKWDPFN